MSEKRKKYRFVFFEQLGHGWVVGLDVIETMNGNDIFPDEEFAGARVGMSLDMHPKNRRK